MKNDRLRGIRNTYKIDQKVLSSWIGISTTAYSLKENGHRSFTQPEMYKIYQYFKKLNPTVTLDEIFLPLDVTKRSQDVI